VEGSITLLIQDPDLVKTTVAARAASGADRYDEVWDGVLVMTPMPNDAHQEIQMDLAAILHQVAGKSIGGRVRAGVNVSDRIDDWRVNFRIPDIAVFLPGTKATNCGTHWCGGPDFAVEITSPGDQTLDKLPFYAAVGVRELLVVDRDPWSLELYRLAAGELRSTGRSTVEQSQALTSQVLPLTFCLRAGEPRPIIDVRHADGIQTWEA
jgi:Uma2 family endonuclease